MASYLFVDVDTLLARLHQRGISLDLYEFATGLRRGAALVAGLASASDLTAVAIANWDREDDLHGGPVSPRQAFAASEFQTVAASAHYSIEEIIWDQYLSKAPSVDELILATNDPAVLDLLSQVRLSPTARVRVWGELSKMQTAIPNVVFQPLEALLGLEGSLVALYVDFENIAISLDKQGYTVNLEHLIARFVAQSRAHGQIIKMAAYAPWGQRGSLPPLVDNVGREITEDAPSRLAMSNIDPVFNLPGKNSADMRIARDVMADLMHPESADVFILASGDRDFNEVINSLRAHNKQVIVWGVRGSVSRQVETNPAVIIEYIEDFTSMQPHEALGRLYGTTSPAPQDDYQPTMAISVRPSQWVSTVLQYDLMDLASPGISREDLEDQLLEVNAVVSKDRAENLVTQAMAMELFVVDSNSQMLFLNDEHPLVEQTRLIRDRIVARVANTLDVRGWEYVNYGFLLKGIAMDRELDRPDLNINDQWRSEWVDCLVREGILHRKLVPHRHNPDDLVPVISLSENMVRRLEQADEIGSAGAGLLYSMVDENALDIMQRRIIISVEQFTSFRGFLWCPLGSLHRRMRAHDPGMVFQQAIEDLLEKGGVDVREYENPQSEFRTKGISLVMDSPLVKEVIEGRNAFVKAMLALYDRHEPISLATISRETGLVGDDLNLWLSIMQDENVLNPVPGRSSQFSLFRTHHTVVSVSGEEAPPTVD